VSPSTQRPLGSTVWQAVTGIVYNFAHLRDRAERYAMEFAPTRLPEVILIKPNIFGDARGYFFESYEKRKFASAGLDLDFVQENQSCSIKASVRGLHYQLQQPQGKLVRVTFGTVFDVAVDVRRSSPTFGQWSGALLDAKDHHMLWVPPGFAHGFSVLSESAVFTYKCTNYYAPQHERSIRWDDPDLAIDWHLSETAEPVLSAKDAAAPRLRDAECYA
jgi:dTDP-4-dehydrorhamnose 3,5-epimerase